MDVELIQEQSYTVVNKDKKEIGSIAQYYKNWFACAVDDCGNVYGLGDHPSKEEALKVILDWHKLGE